MAVRAGSDRVASVLAAVALLSALVGCSSAPEGDSPRPGSGAASHSGGGSSAAPASRGTAAAATSPSLVARRWRLEADVPATALDFDGRSVVLSLVGDNADGSGSRLRLADAATGGTREVAHPSDARGSIGAVAVVGDWVVYVDRSRDRPAGSGHVRWQVRAVDVSTGARRLLAGGGRRFWPDAPVVKSQGGRVLWSTTEAWPVVKLFSWRPGPNAPRLVASVPSMVPGSESVVGDRIVYLGPSAASAQDPVDDEGNDCWSRRVAGGPATPLTRSGLALHCAASSTWLVWSERIGSDEPPPPDGPQSGPYRVRAAPLDDAGSLGDVALLQQGFTAPVPPVVRGSIAAWVDPDDHPVVRDLDSNDTVGEVQRALDGTGSVGRLLAAPGGFLALAQLGGSAAEVRIAALRAP